MVVVLFIVIPKELGSGICMFLSHAAWPSVKHGEKQLTVDCNRCQHNVIGTHEA